MPSRNYKFVWNRDGQKTVFPVKISKSVDSGFGHSSRLICDECETGLKQKYVCQECGEQYTIGQVEKRKDKETDIVYKYGDKKEFINKKVKQRIEVIDEIQFDKIFPEFIEFVDTEKTLEVFSNDEDYSNYVMKLREYLKLKRSVLVCSLGYYSKRIGVMLIPSKSKIVAVPLRDGRLIRPVKQKGIEIVERDVEEKLNEYSKDRNADLYEEFLKKVENGEELTVEEEEEVEEESKPSFLDEDLEKLKAEV